MTMTISFAQSPEALFDLEWLRQKNGITLLKQAIESNRLGNDHEPARLLLHAILLAEQEKFAEAGKILSEALSNLSLDWQYSFMKLAAEQYARCHSRFQSTWHACNAATISFNNQQFGELISAALPIYQTFCHGRCQDDENDALLADLLRSAGQNYKNQLELEKQLAELQAEQAGLQAAMLAGEIPDDLDERWDRVITAGLADGVAELFCQSVIMQVGHDSRTPTQLCRWFHLLEPWFPAELAAPLDAVMAWYTSQPSDPHPDLHAELARIWWLRHRPPDRQRQNHRPTPASPCARAPLRIGVLDFPLLKRDHCASSILPGLQPGSVTLFQYATEATAAPDWPALEAARVLTSPDILEDMKKDQLDILLILHNVPAEMLLFLLIGRPARSLVSWWSDLATFGPDCLDAALVAPEDANPLRTSLSFEPLIPLTIDPADPTPGFIDAMNRILALP